MGTQPARIGKFLARTLRDYLVHSNFLGSGGIHTRFAYRINSSTNLLAHANEASADTHDDAFAVAQVEKKQTTDCL
jgi:hypothetical protein